MSLEDPLLPFPDEDYVGEWYIPCTVGESSPGAEGAWYEKGVDDFRNLCIRASHAMGVLRRYKQFLPATMDVYLVKVHPSGRSDYPHSAVLQQASFSHIAPDYRYVYCATAYAENFRTEAKRLLGLGRTRDVSKSEFVGVPDFFQCSTVLKTQLCVTLGVRKCLFTDSTGRRVFRMQLIVGDATAFPDYGLTWRGVFDKVLPCIDEASQKTPPWLFNYSTRVKLS